MLASWRSGGVFSAITQKTRGLRGYGKKPSPASGTFTLAWIRTRLSVSTTSSRRSSSHSPIYFSVTCMLRGWTQWMGAIGARRRTNSVRLATTFVFRSSATNKRMLSSRGYGEAACPLFLVD